MGLPLTLFDGEPVAFRRRRETRSADDYTSLAVGAAWARATGAAMRHATAAVSACTIRWATAAAQFSVEPANRALAALTADALYLVGAALARNGEAVFLIEVDADGVRLLPVSDFDVHGGADPRGWRYRVSIPGPSTTITRTVGADSVAHFRWDRDPARPWRGRAPLSQASDTVRAICGVERAIGDESSQAHVRLLAPPSQATAPFGPIPSATEEQHKRVEDKFNRHVNDGSRAASVIMMPGQIEPHRLGAEYAGSTAAIREGLERSIFACYGVPPVLCDPRAPGASFREGWRSFRISTLAALASTIEAEVRAKLDANASVSTAPLAASDVASQSRALRSMTESGVPLDEARRLAGLL